MRKWLTLSVLLMVIGQVAIATPIDPRPDGIGIYFDTEGTTNCISAPQPNTYLTAYVLLTNPTLTGIYCWGGTLLLNPTSFPGGITFDIGPDAMNFGQLPWFEVVYSTLRSGNPITLLTVTIFYTGGPVIFGLGCEMTYWGDPYTPCLAYGDPPYCTSIYEMTPSSDLPWTLPAYQLNTLPAYSHVLAGFWGTPNTPCADVAVESETWGALKALYER